MPFSIARAVERGIDVDVDLPGERDQTDLDVRVDLVDEVPRRFLGGDESGGVDVVGLHRQRHVEQHEDPAFARGALGRRDRPVGRWRSRLR